MFTYLLKQCREWPAGKTESETRFLIQENSKPQDLIVYTDGSVTEDQSGWGFIVKQGRQYSLYDLRHSSLTVELEAVTHALRWIASRGGCQTTHAITLADSVRLLQKVKSGMESPAWNASVVDIHLQKFLQMYCPRHAGVKVNVRADRLAGQATIGSGLCLGKT